jgi:hypothetical protein
MLKTLSVKTRRPDLSAAEFRRHYEDRHVPLGLGFQDRFRWRKYARNPVVRVRAGEVGFDCLTEFWVASAVDRTRTRDFARSPEFRVLDEDDRRFLDVDRRLSFEVEERTLTGSARGVDPAGTRRIALVLGRPAGTTERAFGDRAIGLAQRLAREHGGACERVAIDLRTGGEPGPLEMAAVVSLWPRAGSDLPAAFGWPEPPGPCAVVDLDVVETPPELLLRPEGPGSSATLSASKRRRTP